MNNLNEILKKHEMWLRDLEGGERANLLYANLSKASLSGADLRKANLSGADLTGANLSGADLRSADLRGAYLRRADLSGADLRGASLSGANLVRADLARANLVGSDLSMADLWGANLSGADLSGADLRRADLSDAILTDTCLDPANVIPELTDQEILDAGLSVEGDYIVGWRTEVSQFCGDITYKVREEPYIAPVFSTSRTDCHPGIYFASERYLTFNYHHVPIVKCKALRSEVVHAGDKWRAKRLWIMGEG